VTSSNVYIGLLVRRGKHCNTRKWRDDIASSSEVRPKPRVCGRVIGYTDVSGRLVGENSGREHDTDRITRQNGPEWAVVRWDTGKSSTYRCRRCVRTGYWTVSAGASSRVAGAGRRCSADGCAHAAVGRGTRGRAGKVTKQCLRARKHTSCAAKAAGNMCPTPQKFFPMYSMCASTAQMSVLQYSRKVCKCCKQITTHGSLHTRAILSQPQRALRESEGLRLMPSRAFAASATPTRRKFRVRSLAVGSVPPALFLPVTSALPFFLVACRTSAS